MSRSRVLSLVTLVSLTLAALPGADAGSPNAPEITDPQGDVDPLGLTGLKPEEASALDTNATMYDITSAYITAESRTQFLIALKVVDLTGGIEDPDPTDPVPVPRSSVATYDLFFSTQSGDYNARADLDLWMTGDPTQPPIPFHNFTLHRADALPHEESLIDTIPGALDYRNHIVWYVLPKALIGEPADGERLESFYATSGHKGTTLDIAPDLDPLNTDPGAIDPLDPGLPATYGDPYVFGQYPGGPTTAVTIGIEGDDSGSAAPGETLDFNVKVENAGLSDDTMQISTRAPRGWTASADTTSVELSPGSNSIIGLTATPGEEARGGLLIVKATSLNTGQSREVSIALSFDAPAGSGSGGGSGAGSGGSGSGSGANLDGPPAQGLDASEEQDSPGLGLVVSVIALAGLAALRRGRR